MARKHWEYGDTLTAEDLEGAFEELEAQLPATPSAPVVVTASTVLTTGTRDVSCDFVSTGQTITLASASALYPIIQGDGQKLTIANVGTVQGSVALAGSDKFGGGSTTPIPLNPGDTLILDIRQRSAANSNALVYQVM